MIEGEGLCEFKGTSFQEHGTLITNYVEDPLSFGGLFLPFPLFCAYESNGDLDNTVWLHAFAMRVNIKNFFSFYFHIRARFSMKFISMFIPPRAILPWLLSVG